MILCNSCVHTHRKYEKTKNMIVITIINSFGKRRQYGRQIKNFCRDMESTRNS